MKGKKVSRMSPVTLLLLVLAVGLLLFSGIGGARAALNYASEAMAVRLSTKSMDLQLLENGKSVEEGNLLSAVDEQIQLGRAYDEALSVKNNGQVGEYVRITLYRYWSVGENKQTTLKPQFIDLGELGSDWVVDEAASTSERGVYYYTKPLEPGESTSPVFTKLTILPDVAGCITLSEDGTAATYDYNDTSFALHAEADGVQSRSAEDAILSAWGVHVKVAGNGELSLAQ